MSFISSIGPYLTPLSNMVAAGQQARTQGQEILRQRQMQQDQMDWQRAVQQIQLQRQAQQDQIKQMLADRAEQERLAALKLQAMKAGFVPTGPVSREIPSAISLPKAPTTIDTGNPAEDIPGADQRQAQLQAQDSPQQIEIGGEKMGMVPKPPKPTPPVRGQIVQSDKGYVEIDPMTGVAKTVMGADNQPVKGYHPPPASYGSPMQPIMVNGQMKYPVLNKQTHQIEYMDAPEGATPLPKGGGASLTPQQQMEKNAQLKRMSDASNQAVQLLPELEDALKAGNIRPGILAYNSQHPFLTGLGSTSEEKQFIKKMRDMATALFHYEAPRGGEPNEKQLTDIVQRYFGNVGDNPDAVQEGMRLLRRDVMRRQQTNPGAGIIGGGSSASGKPSFQERATQLRDAGKSKEEARQILKAEGYAEVGGA